MQFNLTQRNYHTDVRSRYISARLMKPSRGAVVVFTGCKSNFKGGMPNEAKQKRLESKKLQGNI